MFFIGSYWSARKESREQVADRLARFLLLISTCDSTLAAWFMKGRTQKSANTPLGQVASDLATKLKVNRRDIGSEVMSELGFSVGACNARGVSLQGTLGCYSPHVQNSIVLSYDPSSKTPDQGTMRAMLEAAGPSP